MGDPNTVVTLDCRWTDQVTDCASAASIIPEFISFGMLIPSEDSLGINLPSWIITACHDLPCVNFITTWVYCIRIVRTAVYCISILITGVYCIDIVTTEVCCIRIVIIAVYCTSISFYWQLVVVRDFFALNNQSMLHSYWNNRSVLH